MTKKRDRKNHAALFQTLVEISSNSHFENTHCEDEPLDIQYLGEQPIIEIPDSSKIPRLKRFRVQLLHQWFINNFEPCSVADIGGGKGLLSYLLIKSGWKATVIDPLQQSLPDKYKDIQSDSRVKISPEENVPYIAREFIPELGKGSDLLIGLHAHGCNVRIIDAAAEFGCGFVLLPCCVIDEPFFPRAGVNWLECLTSYSLYKGLDVKPFRLNFKGQNIGICHVGNARQKNNH